MILEGVQIWDELKGPVLKNTEIASKEKDDPEKLALQKTNKQKSDCPQD